MANRDADQLYLKKKVGTLMQEMMVELLQFRPSNPAPFLLAWLRQKSNLSRSETHREELTRLRREVAELKEAQSKAT